MIAVDTNILIYAHRRETRHHNSALKRLTELAEGDTIWALPVFCLAEFTRVVTHLRVFHPPSGLSIALDFLDGLLASPTARLLLPGPRFPTYFRDTCEASEVRGNLAFDAQIAAVCSEHGVSQILTADRDFSRFPGVIPQFI